MLRHDHHCADIVQHGRQPHRGTAHLCTPLGDILKGVDNIISIEAFTPDRNAVGFTEFYEVFFRQPIDHENPAAGTIKQKAFKLPKGKNPNDPFTVAEAIAKCQEIGGTSDGEIYYAKGKISSIKEISTSYGNGTFNISADGTDNNALTCYRSFFLDNQKFTDENQIAVGDEVIVCGKLVNYTDKNGVVTPEFSGNVYIYSLTKGSGAATEGADGSKIVTVADFIAAPESNDVWYQLTGTINNLKDGDAYGNFDLEDATGSVYVYGVLSEKGGAKKQFQDLVAAKGIKNGSKITIVGTRGSYNGKIEVMNAYFISASN